MIPESSTAMPTPLPSRPGAAPTAARTSLAPVSDSSRLWVRATVRLGVMVTTSLRLAIASICEAGSRAERVRVAPKRLWTEPPARTIAARSWAMAGLVVRSAMTITWIRRPRSVSRAQRRLLAPNASGGAVITVRRSGEMWCGRGAGFAMLSRLKRLDWPLPLPWPWFPLPWPWFPFPFPLPWLPFPLPANTAGAAVIARRHSALAANVRRRSLKVRFCSYWVLCIFGPLRCDLIHTSAAA